jgi:hypothetical protein
MLFCLTVLLNNNVKSQQQSQQSELFDLLSDIPQSSFELFDGAFVENEYVVGWVIYVFADSSVVTPSALSVIIHRINNEGYEDFFCRVSTNSKGVFFLEKMPLGNFKLEVMNRKEVVSTKYFSLNNRQINSLQELIIPIEKVEKATAKMQQRQQEF